MTDDPSGRKTPPQTEGEWAYLWQNARRMQEAWPVIGPFVAIIRNWKAALAVILFVVWLNQPEILKALSTLVGIK